MAQDPETPTGGGNVTEAPGRDSKFHYYAGGEVKENANTSVSPLFYVVMVLLILGAIFWQLWGGGSPKLGAYKPPDGTKANLDQISQDLLVKQNSQNLSSVNSVDMASLPLPPGQTLDQAITKGQDLYQTYGCVGCHGPNQDGNGPGAGSLNPKPRNLRDAPFMQAMSYQRINTSIHKGVPGTAMPRWENTLTDAEIQDLIAYVFSLTAPTPPTPTATATPGPQTPAAAPAAPKGM